MLVVAHVYEHGVVLLDGWGHAFRRRLKIPETTEISDCIASAADPYQRTQEDEQQKAKLARPRVLRTTHTAIISYSAGHQDCSDSSQEKNVDHRGYTKQHQRRIENQGEEQPDKSGRAPASYQVTAARKRD